MRRIPSIFGFSNHIHRNIPNDAFMDLEVIKHHLPELLDLRELLLHLSYEDSEGKCLLKEATETFIPIYFKVNLSFADYYYGGVPSDIKEKFQSLTLEDWSKMFKDFDNPCALAPQIKGDLICLPVPFESCLHSSSSEKDIPIENPIKDILKVEKEGSIYSTIFSRFFYEYLSIRILIEDGYSAKKLFNVFDLDITVRPYINTETYDSTPTYKYAEYQVLTETSGIDLDLTPVTFTKLVRNEE